MGLQKAQGVILQSLHPGIMHKVNIRMLVWVPSTSLGLWEQAPHLCLGDAQHRTHPLGLLLLLLLPVKSLHQAETMLVN